MSNSNSSKQVLLSVIGIAILIIAVVGVTFAFFNYTRTGISNTIKVGRISFNSTQNNTINLTNVFPITSNEATGENSNYDEVEIIITGDTTYSQGIEYLVTAVDVNNAINGKKIPITIEVIGTNGLGNQDASYFDNRGGQASEYKILSQGIVKNNGEILAGYIANGQTGVNGTVTIKAYIDKNSIAITDTYPPTEIEDVINNNMNVDELSSCITFINEIWYYAGYLDSGTTAETFCQGTGTSYGETISTWYENDWFDVDELNYLKQHRVIIPSANVTNETTDEWVDGRIVLTTEEWNSLQNTNLSFKVKVEANEGIWIDNPNLGYNLVKKSINNYDGNSKIVYIDNMDTSSEISDDVIYLSGDNSVIDFNYVWYSGKLWRIVALYPDGRMKLVTENMITSISWGNNDEYDGSWIYQWLNEDFYNTLYNKDNIVDSDSVWNYSNTTTFTPVRPETIETQKTKVAPVGLLNTYELYNSYKCIGSDTCTGTSATNGYLNIRYEWWLMTVYGNSNIRAVNIYGEPGTAYCTSTEGVRPSIVIKSGLEFIGDGTISSPYIIVGDKGKPINNTSLISSRNIGEYVRFDNGLYRIVDITNGLTKILRLDPMSTSKKISSSVYYGKAGNVETDDYWDYYLNNTWYNSISPNYKNMLVDGMYYLGLYNNTNYKATICKDADLNSVTVANCTKYTSSDADKTYTGKVGLLRVGEMFSVQLKDGFSSSTTNWLITPYSSSYVNVINYNGYLDYNLPSSSYMVYPTITLKSGIKITDGTGMENDPFEISE